MTKYLFETTWGYRPWSRFLSLLCLVLMLALSPGCLSHGTQEESETVIIEADIAERMEGSLEIDVVTFAWSYLNEGAHLRILAEVVNNTGTPQQAITIFGSIYDENGQAVGHGQSFLAPTYLPPGGQGKFEIMVMPRRTKGIRYLKLVTTARTLQ